MADSPLSSSLPSVKDLEVGYFIKPRVDMKDEAVQVNIPDFSEVPRRKPLPESSIGYAQHEENVRPFRESSLATGWSMALWKDRLRFGGEKKKQRLFLGGLIASIILLALIVGLSVGLTRNK